MPHFIRTILEERYLYLLALFGLGIGLPLGKAIISISGIVLVCAWVFDGLFCRDFKDKWNRFARDRVALSITGIWLIHLVGLLWTADMDYGMHDLRIKLPLLFMPLIFSSMPPLSRPQQRVILLGHMAAIIVCMAVACVAWQIQSGTGDLRSSIDFISHIRLALLIVLSIMVGILHFRPKTVVGISLLVIYIAIGTAFMLQAKLVTGLSIFFVVALALLARSAWRSSRRALYFSLPIALALIVGSYVYIAYADYFETEGATMVNEASHTALGTPYYVPAVSSQVENGRYVWQHYAPKEMEEAWAERSDADLFADRLKLHGGLTRYLTAKDLRKDASGVRALSKEDIGYIEEGRVRPPEMDKGAFAQRLDVLFYELSSLRAQGDPNGQSINQRLVYWKTGYHIWQQNLILGVGTGDVKQAFADQYIADNSPLLDEYRHRAHQQFLTITIALGLIGGLIFILLLTVPFSLTHLRADVLVMVFMAVMILSFLGEDTLETQAGVTIYIFYMAILVLAMGKGRIQENEHAHITQ